METTCPCLNCLSADSAQLRLDRRQRPFVKCLACGCTTFIPTKRGLLGLKFLAPGLLETLRSQYGSLAAAQETMLGQLSGDLRAAAGLAHG